MTAMPLNARLVPPVALRQKPAPVRTVFRDVGHPELRTVPGRHGLPWLGILPEAVLDPLGFTRRMYETYGPVHRFRACGSWNVQLIGPEANELVLADRDGLFSSEGGWRPVFGKHFGGGLLLRDGEDHRWHRKLIASAFRQDQLQNYLGIFARNIAAFAESSAGHVENLHGLAQRLTFLNGYESFLGRDPRLATSEDLLAFRSLMQSAISVLPYPLPGTAERRARWAKRHVTALILDLLAKPPAADRTDLLAVLQRLQADRLLDADEIVAHLTFVIAASFDTLSSATCSTLFYLAANPEWQARARNELCATIADPERPLLGEVQGCDVAERCIKEALRLNAAAPVLWRRSVRPFRFAGYDFPAGTITGVNPMLTHLLPSLWPNPAAYDPDRFSPERSLGRHRYAFVPFGGGAHGCIGANYAISQLRVLLRILLERYELRPAANARAPSWYHWPNCRPRQPLALELVARAKS